MNVMPADATTWVDVRTIPGVDHAELVAELATLADAAADHDITANVSVIDDRPAVATAEAPVVRALSEAHAAVTGQPARFGGVPGATDGTI